MSDEDKPAGMGVVKRRRSRKLLENRVASDSDAAAKTNDAASAWGAMLEREVRGEPETPSAIESHPGRPAATRTGPLPNLRTQKRELPEFLKEDDEPKRRKPPTNSSQPDAVPPERAEEMALDDAAGYLAARHASREEKIRFDTGASVSLRKARLGLSIAAFVVATVLAGLPVWGDLSTRRQAEALQKVLAEQATRVKAAEDVEALVRRKDVQGLRALHDRFQPEIVTAVKDAGFPKAAPENVSIRVDFEGRAVVLGAAFERGGDQLPLTAQASTAGAVGRPLPPASLGATVGEHAVEVATFYALALVLSLAFYLGPGWMEKLEEKRRYAEGARRRAEAEAAYRAATEEEGA